MTPERAAEVAKQMGLDEAPKSSYTDLPPENLPMGRLVEFKKMVMLCSDSILTNSFWRHIPDCVVIDHMMDGSSYSGDNCFATLLRTDVPPPVNAKITRVTGIRPTLDFENYLIWMGLVLKEYWTALRPRAMAPPLLCRGYGGRAYKRMPGARPFLGMAMKFDLRPPDGQTMKDIQPQYGCLLPGTTQKVKGDHIFLPQAPTPDEAA